MKHSAGDAAIRLSLSGRIRIALRVATLFLWLALCLPFALLIRPFAAHNPVAPLFLGGVGRILGMTIAVHGGPIRGRAVLLANHITWLDIPALAAVSGTAFVAHSGLAANAGLRFLCQLNNTVFIARDNRRSVAAQIQQVREAIDADGRLTIFPEGGTGPGDPILPFKSSLLSALTPLPPGVAVRPVWLDYGADTHEIAWIGEESGITSFLKIAARRTPVRLAIHYLPPLDEDQLADRKTMATAARDAITRRMEAVRRDERADQRVAL